MKIPIYVKLVCFDEPHLTYYVRKNLISEWNDSKCMRMQIADFVINHQINEFVKCRYTLEDLLDALSMIDAAKDVVKKQHE